MYKGTSLSRTTRSGASGSRLSPGGLPSSSRIFILGAADIAFCRTRPGKRDPFFQAHTSMYYLQYYNIFFPDFVVYLCKFSYFNRDLGGEDYCFDCKWSTWPWEPKESYKYTDYIASYIIDLKKIYEVNKWPCYGISRWTDRTAPPAPLKTLEEKLADNMNTLRPWGGSMALKWPKMGEKPELLYFLG